MYKLTRLDDGLIRQSVDVMWIQWKEDGRFDSKHNEPAIGRSLFMSPFNPIFYTWQTTQIIAFKLTVSGVEFVTKNSNYVLERIEEILVKEYNIKTNTNDHGLE